ncbi:MAG: hypothetical protein MR459_05665, partial [Enterocloster aldenensis]|nr:hypothetical protein [Enterocloster aldenensis]
APIASSAAVDNTATNFVCFLIINALSFFFLKYFLKFLIALRVDYTSDKEKYRHSCPLPDCTWVL